MPQNCVLALTDLRGNNVYSRTTGSAPSGRRVASVPSNKVSSSTNVSSPTKDPETPKTPEPEAKSAPEPAAESSDEKKAEPAADEGKIPTACAKQTDICTMPSSSVPVVEVPDWVRVKRS